MAVATFEGATDRLVVNARTVVDLTAPVWPVLDQSLFDAAQLRKRSNATRNGSLMPRSNAPLQRSPTLSELVLRF